MRLKLREINGAYIGKHCEVVGPLGQRVYPEGPPRVYTLRGLKVPLGTNRDACVGFLAGYDFARKNGGKN